VVILGQGGKGILLRYSPDGMMYDALESYFNHLIHIKLDEEVV